MPENKLNRSSWIKDVELANRVRPTLEEFLGEIESDFSDGRISKMEYDRRRAEARQRHIRAHPILEIFLALAPGAQSDISLFGYKIPKDEFQILKEKINI